MSSCWMNGKMVEQDSATVSIRDAGLLHGAGVFTTMRAYSGKVFRLTEHLQRLRRSCESLFVPLNYTDEQLAAAADDLLQADSLGDARLRLTTTRGPATSDPLHGMRLDPNTFITATPLEPYPQEYYQTGMTALAYDLQKLNPYDLQAGHKTLDYFSRLESLRYAKSHHAGEAMWFNVHNYLQSGSISNVFIVKGGELHTPPAQAEMQPDAASTRSPYPISNVLPGITRQAVIELAQQIAVPVNFRALSIEDLLGADECFVTNSIMEVLPVVRIEAKPVGSGKPGDLTHKLAMLYQKAIEQFVESV